MPSFCSSLHNLKTKYLGLFAHGFVNQAREKLVKTYVSTANLQTFVKKKGVTTSSTLHILDQLYTLICYQLDRICDNPLIVTAFMR